MVLTLAFLVTATSRTQTHLGGLIGRAGVGCTGLERALAVLIESATATDLPIRHDPGYRHNAAISACCSHPLGDVADEMGLNMWKC